MELLRIAVQNRYKNINKQEESEKVKEKPKEDEDDFSDKSF